MKNVNISLLATLVFISCNFDDSKKPYINNVSHSINESKLSNIFISEYISNVSLVDCFDTIWIEYSWMYNENKEIIKDGNKKQLLFKLKSGDALEFYRTHKIVMRGSEESCGIQDDLLVFPSDSIFNPLYINIYIKEIMKTGESSWKLKQSLKYCIKDLK